MAKYRSRLPQLDGGLFLTDGGIETTLIFHDGLELPYFAAFHLLKDAEGPAALRKYYHALRRDRARRRFRLHPGEPDVAGERRLGRKARVFRSGLGRGQPRVDRAHAGAARGVRDASARRWSSAAASGRAATATIRAK